MPIFEFRCNACSREFELLVFSGEQADCPHCGSLSLSRLPSLFGVRAGGSGGGNGASAASSSSCGGCRQTSCAGCKS